MNQNNVLAQNSGSQTTFSIEQVGDMNSGCPSIGDEGHLVFLFLIWLGLILALWPRQAIRQFDATTQQRWQRQGKFLLISTILLVVLSLVSVTRISGWFGLSALGTAFLAFITSAPAAQAFSCPELSDGYPTLRFILYLLTLTNLGLLLGARFSALIRAKTLATISKHNQWLLVSINAIQLIMLVFMVIWAVKPYIIADWFRVDEALLY